MPVLLKSTFSIITSAKYLIFTVLFAIWRAHKCKIVSCRNRAPMELTWGSDGTPSGPQVSQIWPQTGPNGTPTGPPRGLQHGPHDGAPLRFPIGALWVPNGTANGTPMGSPMGPRQATPIGPPMARNWEPQWGYFGPQVEPSMEHQQDLQRATNE